TERSYTASLKNFEDFLLKQFKQGKIPVLLIDEAQYLNRDTLKLIHYLLNFETNRTKLLQIVLVGQEELGSKILHYKELASRMFPIVINAMSIDDLRDMINFRLTVAGYRGELFEDVDESYKTLYTYTKGLPRDARLKSVLNYLLNLPQKARKKHMQSRLKKLRKDKTFECNIWGDLTH